MKTIKFKYTLLLTYSKETIEEVVDLTNIESGAFFNKNVNFNRQIVSRELVPDEGE